MMLRRAQLLAAAAPLAAGLIVFAACGGDDTPETAGAGRDEAQTGEGGGPTGFVATDGEGEFDGMRDTGDDFASDAEWYANDQGISIEEAERRLALQAEAGPIVEQAQQMVPGRWAGSWLEHQPAVRLVIQLKGDDPAPAELLALADGGELPVDVTVGATHTVDELLDATERIRASLPGEDFGSGVDFIENAVNIYWYDEISDDELAAMEADLEAEFGVNVLVERSGRPELQPGIDPAPADGPSDGVPVEEGDGPALPFDRGEPSGAPEVEWYAREYGVSEEEARRRLELQEAGMEQAPALEAAAGDRFAGVWLEHGPDLGFVLLLAGDAAAPAEVTATANAGPVPVDVRTGADHSLADLGDALGAIERELRDAHSYGPDIQRNAIAVYWPADASDAELADLEARLSAQAGVPVIVERSEQPQLLPAAAAD